MPHHSPPESSLFHSIVEVAMNLRQSTATFRTPLSRPQGAARPVQVLKLREPPPLAPYLRALGLLPATALQLSNLYLKAAVELKADSEPRFVQMMAALENSVGAQGITADLPQQLQAVYTVRYQSVVQSWATSVVSSAFIMFSRLDRSTHTFSIPFFKGVGDTSDQDFDEDDTTACANVALKVLQDKSAIAADAESSLFSPTSTAIPLSVRAVRHVLRSPDDSRPSLCKESPHDTTTMTASVPQDSFHCEPPSYSFPTKFPLSAEMASTLQEKIDGRSLPVLLRPHPLPHSNGNGFTVASVSDMFEQLAIEGTDGSPLEDRKPIVPHTFTLVPPRTLVSSKSAPLSPILSLDVVPSPPLSENMRHPCPEKHVTTNEDNDCTKSVPRRRRLAALPKRSSPIPFTTIPSVIPNKSATNDPVAKAIATSTPFDHNGVFVETGAPGSSHSLAPSSSTRCVGAVRQEPTAGGTIGADLCPPMSPSSTSVRKSFVTPLAMPYNTSFSLVPLPMAAADKGSIPTPRLKTPTAFDHLRRAVGTQPQRGGPSAMLSPSNPPTRAIAPLSDFSLLCSGVPEVCLGKQPLGLSIPPVLLPTSSHRRSKFAGLPVRRRNVTSTSRSSSPYPSSSLLRSPICQATVSRIPSLTSPLSSSPDSPVSTFDELETPPSTPSIRQFPCLDDNKAFASSFSFGVSIRKGNAPFIASPTVVDTTFTLGQSCNAVKREDIEHYFSLSSVRQVSS